MKRDEQERLLNVRLGFQITLSTKEKEVLLAAAKKLGKPLAAFIREVALQAAQKGIRDVL